jgi:GNAT superfamily N-acetyltransferase
MLQQATLEDVETITQHRLAMFRDMGHQDEAALTAMASAFRPWLRRKMAESEYLAWFVVDPQGEIAAGLGLWLMDWPPHMVGPGARRGNILNVYTRPQDRRRGMARELMAACLDWCRANGVHTVILHSSHAGRPLYEKLGFQGTNEMRIILPSDKA